MRYWIALFALGCGGPDAPSVTIDRGLEFAPVTENPFTSDELVLEGIDASFAFGEGFADHFALRRTEPEGLSCTLGTVIWTRAEVDDRDIVEVGFTAIGEPTFRLLDTGNTELELRGRFERGPSGTCISDLPEELDVRTTLVVRVFEPVGMVLDRVCLEDQDPLLVATRSWLPLEALAVEDPRGDRFRPLNLGAPGPAPFPVEVRTTTGEVLPVEPARDDAFDNLPGVRAPMVPTADVVVEGPAGYRLQWDVVGPDDISAEIAFTQVTGGATVEIAQGDVVNAAIETGPLSWVVPVPSGIAVRGESLCGAVDPAWFQLSTSDAEVCPVERWPRLDDVPAELRAVSPDVLTAARLSDVGPCELSVYPPGVDIGFDVQSP